MLSVNDTAFVFLVLVPCLKKLLLDQLMVKERPKYQHTKTLWET
jgi:hypothetical protein